MPQLTAEMLCEAFQQTQREILEIETPERYQARWERMAELLNGKIIAGQPDPVLQPDQFEQELFAYGYLLRHGPLMTRGDAERAAQQKIGQSMIIPGDPGQLVRIVSTRLEYDPLCPDGSKGCVIAICEPVEGK